MRLPEGISLCQSRWTGTRRRCWYYRLLNKNKEVCLLVSLLPLVTKKVAFMELSAPGQKILKSPQLFS